ncbi:Uncharacterised protein [Burkholderia pseudomallei]|uniref:nSTAND3 domain-containing NTPase n=1 Tax=Burkholderia pseudomallei TaxID=28450 RepID=UPI000975A1F7|nr:hypothetical protein [Burkholderia pseudomallei]MBF3381674.1 hypothetical protein [Burkholderia pseudomallei]MBF3408129.1 hypothetical protein [Burkholderia pseudomallei]CAJ3632254.1 Uncharacterised protein [Burkholderia pseudomallei]CAJ4463918.1 Uncharacterised protein [Burkholderia pseudomallei]CAJ6445233.1 Uncharacterised protein [Burkholderia pseudomallei]
MAFPTPAKVQASEVTFELQSLGWKAFQQLCASIVAEVWGQLIQAFYESNDGGRDGAFRGDWQTAGGERLSGSFTVQCKFVSSSSATLKLSDLQDELTKAQRLAAAGLADNYFVFTNARLTGRNEEAIRARVEAIPGIKHCALFGGERITQFIRESPRLRMLVPRVYGLGDLSQILDERAYAQAAEILSALGDDLGKFVITGAYQRSAQALVEHGFVLLLGEPACGKSTIAAALALGAIDEWGCSTVKVRDADDFVSHFNPHHEKQFFWVDDAFGATQLDWQGTIAWNRTFPHVQAAIRRGAKVVFTSRDYIYQAAKRFLKQSALPVIQESQVVIRVEQLTKGEKEQILYNHIRLGSQNIEFKRRVKPLLAKVAAHARFSPEIARRLGNREFTKRLVVGASGLDEFVARPMDLLKEVIQTLDASTRSALALVFMRGGALSSPVTLELEEEAAVSLMGGSIAEVRNSLTALNGSLLVQVLHEGTYAWRFKHPTIRDAIAALVAENRELMDIYLAGTPLRQLFLEISCGEMGVAGVKVIVPNDRFGVLLTRMQTLFAKRRENWDSLNRFLSYRCSCDFLHAFIARNPWFIGELHVGSYLSAVSDVDVIVRLHECKLLPEQDRLRHVARIRELAVETPDSDFLREDVRPIFEGSELEGVLDEVRTKLLPNLELTVDNWQDNYDDTDDPASYFDPLKSAFKDYREALSDESESVMCIDAGLDFIEAAIEELRSNSREYGEPSDSYREAQHGSVSDGSRSIFDDVDQ